MHLNKIKKKLRNNTEILALGLLLLTTILSTTYYNFNKQKIYNNLRIGKYQKKPFKIGCF